MKKVITNTYPKPTVSNALVHVLARFLEKKGMYFKKICQSAGIVPSVFAKNDERMAAEQFLKIWDQAEQAVGDDNFGLQFGRELAADYLGGNILISMMANCSTVGSALKIFCKYHLLMENAVLPKMAIGDNVLSVSWEFFIPDVKIPRQHAESVLSALSEILRVLSDNRIAPQKVCFGHSPPADTREHQMIFNTRLLFDQPANALEISRKDADRPIFLASRELFETLELLAEKRLGQLNVCGSWTDKVSRELQMLMARGDALNVDTVSGNLALSSRSLQMKLQKEGSTFMQLLEQLRKEAALAYLNDPEVSICDIALLLGFSEQSAFNHAFKRWTGTSPGKYRSRLWHSA